MRKADILFRVWLITIAVWIFLYLIINNKADWDLWGVMSFGALLDQNPGFFPYRDMFSYTANGEPWIYHEWGSGVIFYQLFKHAGSQALFWLKMLLVCGTFLLACHQMIWPRPGIARLRGANAALFCLCLVAGAYVMLPIVNSTIRCQLFTFFGFALFLFLLERHRVGLATRAIWTLPPLMLLWVNIHGGFITGLAALGVYWLYHFFEKNRGAFQQLSMILLLCAISTLINPYGLDFLLTMLSAWSLPREAIAEWGNVFKLEVPLFGAIYTLLLLFWLGCGTWRWLTLRTRFPYVLLLLTMTGVYGWMHHKLAPLFIIALLAVGFQLHPIPASIAQRIDQRWGRRARQIGWLAALLLLALGGLTSARYLSQTPHVFHTRTQGSETVRHNVTISRFAYPIGVVAFMRKHKIQGHLWAPYAWGQFLYWNLYPENLVSFDGRYETIYPMPVYKAWHRFFYPPYLLDAALDYSTTHILLPVFETQLVQRIAADQRWQPIYKDELTILYARATNHPPKIAPAENSQTILLDELKGDLSRFRLSEADRQKFGQI